MSFNSEIASKQFSEFFCIFSFIFFAVFAFKSYLCEIKRVITLEHESVCVVEMRCGVIFRRRMICGEEMRLISNKIAVNTRFIA